MKEKVIKTSISGDKITKENEDKYLELDGHFLLIGDPKIQFSGEVYKLGKNYYIPNDLAWSIDEGKYVSNKINLGNKNYLAYCINTVLSDKLKIVILEYCMIDDSKLLDCAIIKPLGVINKAIGYDRKTLEKYGFKLYARCHKLSTATYKAQPNDGFYFCNPDIYNLANIENQGFINKLNKDYISSLMIPEGLAKLDSFLGNLTYGVEIENSESTIEELDLLKCGFTPLKDGSIAGYEFTSVPLQGKEGLTSLVELTNNLKAKVNNQCSLHCHIGNVPYASDEFFLAMYLLYYDLQTELTELSLPYKVDLNYLKKKPKDHCARLPRLGLRDHKFIKNDGTYDKAVIQQAAKTLFTFWNDNHPPNNDFNRASRIHIKHNEAKWHVNSRYHSLNLYNLLFSDSGTVEYRIHHGTTNGTKILNWLLICIAITRYAMTYTKEILQGNLKLHLDDILNEYTLNFGELEEATEDSKFIAKYLIEYTHYRKSEFIKNYFNYDELATKEFANDSGFTYQLEGKDLVNF